MTRSAVPTRNVRARIIDHDGPVVPVKPTERDPFRELAAAELAVEQLRQEQAREEFRLPVAPADLPNVPGLDPDVLRVALSALADSHKITAEAAVALVTQAVAERGTSNGDLLAVQAIDALRALASRPDPPQPHINVTMPDQQFNVPAPVVTVNVPEQAAPVVNVQAPPPAEVNVDVQNAPPSVVVNVPEQQPQPAPVVNLTVPEARVDVHVPQPKSRSVRVEFDSHGNKRFVTEDEGE